MPISTMEWNGRHAQVNDNGELETSIWPTHVEVGVYVKAFANLYSNGWIQVPVKLTEYEGQDYIGIGNLKKALTYYVKFLKDMALNIYKGTGTSWHTVEVDARPGSVHEGQDVPFPLANNQFMKVSTYFILEFQPLHTSVDYKVMMDTLAFLHSSSSTIHGYDS